MSAKGRVLPFVKAPETVLTVPSAHSQPDGHSAARQEPHRVFAPRPSASARLSIAVLKGRVVFLRPTTAAHFLETPVGTTEARSETHGPLAEVAFSACLNFQCMLRSGLHIDHSPRELRAGMLHRDPRLVFRSDGPTRSGWWMLAPTKWTGSCPLRELCPHRWRSSVFGGHCFSGCTAVEPRRCPSSSWRDLPELSVSHSWGSLNPEACEL